LIVSLTDHSNKTSYADGKWVCKMTCAALFKEDQPWYRVNIEEVGENNVSVKYIDFGNLATIPKKFLRKLPASFGKLSCSGRTCVPNKVRIKISQDLFSSSYRFHWMQSFCPYQVKMCALRQGLNQLLFSWVAKWCNSLLHHTNTYFCENFGGVNCLLPLVAALHCQITIFTKLSDCRKASWVAEYVMWWWRDSICIESRTVKTFAMVLSFCGSEMWTGPMFSCETAVVISRSQIVSTMSYLRFILIGTHVDKYERTESD